MMTKMKSILAIFVIGKFKRTVWTNINYSVSRSG